jgi:Kelch motif
VNSQPNQIYTPEYRSGMLNLPSDTAQGMDVSQLFVQVDTEKLTSSLQRLEPQRLIHGVVKIEPAANEDDIFAYDVYWGVDNNTALPNVKRIATLSVNSTELSFNFSRGTHIPTKASHLLVFSRNAHGRHNQPFAQPLGDRWLAGEAMGIARTRLSGRFDGRYVFTVAGEGSSSELDVTEVYDSLSESWSLQKEFRYATTGTASGVLNHTLYISGGTNNTETFKLLLNDSITDEGEWRLVSPSPTHKVDAASTVIDNKLYILGGKEGGAGISSKVEVFTLPAGNEDGVWYSSDNFETNEQAPKALKPARDFSSACTVGGEIYLLGGIDVNSNVLASAQSYHVRKRDWSDKADMLFPRSGAMCGALGRYIYIFGGDEKDGKQVERFDLYNGSWSTKAPMPTSRKHGALALIAGNFYLIGGEDEFGQVLSSMDIYIPD